MCACGARAANVVRHVVRRRRLYRIMVTDRTSDDDDGDREGVGIGQFDREEEVDRNCAHAMLHKPDAPAAKTALSMLAQKTRKI